MKRQLPLSFVILGCLLAVPAALTAEDPVATAAREEAAANYQNLSARLSRLEEDLHSAQRQIQKLDSENYRLRDELERLKNRNENAATLEKIGRLQDALKEVDKARIEGDKTITSQFDTLKLKVEKAIRTVIAMPPPQTGEEKPPKSSSTSPPGNSNPGPKSNSEVGLEYTIKNGDTLIGIMKAAREQKGFKLTQKQMEEANPGVNWSKLRIGQKIFIPTPAQ